MTLIEIMVGVVIALIAVLVIYQVFNTAEAFKRNTTAAGDAQQNGLISSFLLAVELASAGNALMVASDELAQCPDTTTMAAPTPSLRPIPVLITDGGADANPDTMIVNYSMAHRIVSTVLFTKAALPGNPFTVQSPTGFTVGDQVVAISPGAPGACEMSTVTNVGPVTAVTGEVVVTHTPVAATFGASSFLFNLGPPNTLKRSRYDVSNGVLRSLDLLTAGAATNPIASNVMNLKMQYGVDDVGDGLLHTWVPATGDWTSANVLAAPLTAPPGSQVALNRIKAVRIGIIVRSEQFDRDRPDYPWVLFDCSDANKANCPGRLTGTIAAAASPAGNWRYRIYETIIPLRNGLWNTTS